MVLHQDRYIASLSNCYVMWVIIHLSDNTAIMRNVLPMHSVKNRFPKQRHVCPLQVIFILVSLYSAMLRDPLLLYPAT